MADQKLTALTALTAPANEDILYIVDDPSGTPLSRKITRTDFFAGSDLPGALTINGSADAIQLTVQGHSTQTSDIFVVEKSDGTDLLTIDNSGLGVLGATAIPRQAHIVDADGTLADVTSKFNTLLSYLENFGFIATS